MLKGTVVKRYEQGEVVATIYQHDDPHEPYTIDLKRPDLFTWHDLRPCDLRDASRALDQCHAWLFERSQPTPG